MCPFPRIKRVKGFPFTLYTYPLTLFLIALLVGLLSLPISSAATEQDPIKDARRQIKAGQPEQALVTLQAFLQQSPAEPYRRQAHFLMGKTLSSSGRHQEALPYLQIAALAPSPAKDYLLFYLFQSYEASGQKPAAQKILEELLNSHSASPLAHQARLALARIHQEQRDLARARKLLESGSAESLEARFLLGELLKPENPSAALKIFRAIYLQRPASLWAEKAQNAARSLGKPIILGESDSFARGQKLMDGGHYTLAAAQWSRFLIQFPQSSRRWQARLQLGIAQFKGRDYSGALKTLQEVVKKGPSALRGEGLFWLGWAALRTSKEDLYQQAFTQLFEQHAKNHQTGRAWYIWGRHLEDEGDKASAQVAYQQLLKQKPVPQLEEEGWWRQGWVLYKSGQYQEAAQNWRELLRTYPQCPSAPQAQYWLGRVYEREDNPLLARITYQEIMQKDRGGYYGWLAQERWLVLAKDTAEAKTLAASQTNGIWGMNSLLAADTLSDSRGEVTSPLQTIDAPFFVRQEELLALDLEPAAVLELNIFAKSLPPESPAWKEVLNRFYQMNAHEKALYWAKKIFRQGQINLFQQYPQYLYPQGYWNQISAGAKKTGLDPYLILAVVREESAFGPGVVSHAGAHGLMQLLRDTAQKVARKENIPFNPQDIHQPELNVTLGSLYLADMIQEMGSVPLALAAYNAGPHRVRAWKVDWNRKQEEFLEDIPFDETRNYVKRVLNSYRIYKTLYADTAAAQEGGYLTIYP